MGQLNTPKGVGGLVVSEDVIAKIAASSALSANGVAEVSPKPSDIRNYLIRDKESRSVRVSRFRNTLVIDIYITVAEGANITTVAADVQHRVKDSVQSMTGRPVSRVNVCIVDVAVRSTDEYA